MHSEGILAGEMKPGPLALVDEHMPVIVLATQDRTCNQMHSVVQRLRARGANPLVVCNVGDDQIAGVCEGAEGRLIRVHFFCLAFATPHQQPHQLDCLAFCYLPNQLDCPAVASTPGSGSLRRSTLLTISLLSSPCC